MAVDVLALVPTIVDVGLAACLRAQGDGIEARLSHMAVGRGIADGGTWKGYVPSRTQTGLVREDVRAPILSGTKVPDFGFRVLARIPRTTDGSELPIREVGWYLESGEMLCVWSEVAAAPLAYRTPRAEVDLAHELYLRQLPLSILNITVQQPDIPDPMAGLFGLFSTECRLFIAALEAERRSVDRKIY
ncbi:phage tail-collar fiber domain-containing protein [Methylobacterium sp. SyP6R]|uniref:phage tail-collar fiber domain-containing protein n=1 Tax=Methylobacterium sp. SyP6R TaxID=2718876 RepID=UPI001F2D7153|nr:phage tail protein [Methylobacterium sp. SyP6R]MCF4125048.1 phage tail protein [Methylobacterium sp. SyP6R]